MTLNKEEILNTRKRIEGHIHNTPVLHCQYFDDFIQGKLLFKCENFQKTGSFKMRGASNAVIKSSEARGANLFTTHSSGNHGQALAAAAHRAGAKAIIVMPKNAPKVKIDAVKSYGAKIVFCNSTTADREKTCNRVIQQTGAVFIPPYDAHDIIEGQATCAAEILKGYTNLDYILTPVGGGGLLAGTKLAASAINPSTIVIGCEPQNADDAFQSMQKGVLIPQNSPNTIADGLRTSLGELNFKVLTENKTKILRVTEQEILMAMQIVYERMKIVIEPSCAVPVAAVMKNKFMFTGKKTGIILSGGNVDLKVFFEDLKLKIQH